METKRSWSGAVWEERAGYCRAIRVGDHVWVAATGPYLEDGRIAAPGDLEGQTRRCLQIIAAALADVGAGPEHAVATRMYLTDVSQAAAVSGPHREMFGLNPPASTLVEVSGLVHPEMLIEVEVEAIVRAI